MERDLFDLFLIKDPIKVSIEKVVEKIINSSLIKRDLEKIIKDNLERLENDEFFKSEERITDLAIIKYDEKGFEEFKEKITPVLINICELFLKNMSL